MLKKLCQCLGIASLILVGNYGDLLGGGEDVRMHTPLPLARICYAQIADILIWRPAVRHPLRRWSCDSPLSAGCVFCWSWSFRLTSSSAPSPSFPFDLIEGIVTIFFIVWVGTLLLLTPALSKVVPPAACMSAEFVAASLIIFALCSIAQLLWVATWKPAPNQITAAWNRSGPAQLQPPHDHPLLVWIIFDELSYDQTFEHRAGDLSLPNFDALRAQSTLFTDAQPAGYHTVKVVPSLLTGKIVDGIRYNFHNRLWVHHESESGWQPLDGAQTVFGDAENAGWRTAAVGWYNPYCAIYADAMQNCFWTNRDMFDGLMAQDASFADNVYIPLEQVVREIRSPAAADRHLCGFDVRHRYLTHVDLQQHTSQLLHSDQADFIFLHIPVPHSPNIWSRIRNDYTQQCDSSYLDSLALADRILGGILATLEASPRWNQTTLIVQGDHSWRIDAWNWLPAWTEEDDAASRGVFDQRPAMIIHQPGQTQPQTVSTPWPIIQIHSVVEQTLHNQQPTFGPPTTR
jgi:hypothetical protein